MILVTVPGAHLHTQAWEDETPTAMAAPRSLQVSVVSRQKMAMRRSMRAVRAEQDPALGALVCEHVLRDLPITPGAVVAGVWPLPGEIDLRPLWHALHMRSHAILLPETPPRGHPLIFRRWHPGCAMLAERFGTLRPDGDVATPDLIFVPLLAFDLAGQRLGYGGGYYDRTLAALPAAQAVGFAYAAQQVHALPAEPHDRPLPLIFTEQGRVVTHLPPTGHGL